MCVSVSVWKRDRKRDRDRNTDIHTQILFAYGKTKCMEHWPWEPKDIRFFTVHSVWYPAGIQGVGCLPWATQITSSSRTDNTDALKKMLHIATNSTPNRITLYMKRKRKLYLWHAKMVILLIYLPVWLQSKVKKTGEMSLSKGHASKKFVFWAYLEGDKLFCCRHQIVCQTSWFLKYYGF